MKAFFVLFFTVLSISTFSQRRNLVLEISTDGSISWKVEKYQVHSDHIEMCGLNISSIITYGVDINGELVDQKKLPPFD